MPAIKKPEERKTKVVSIRFTESEYQQLAECATDYNIPTVIRTAIREYIQKKEKEGCENDL